MTLATDASDLGLRAYVNLRSSQLRVTYYLSNKQARLVDSNVEGVVIKNSGHWLMEEATRQVIPQLIAFISKSP